MSITEQAGKAAQSTIDALKSTPVVLALVVFNVLFMFLMTYAGLRSSERWDKEVQRWADLVAHCTLKVE
jgi:predicted PurR-regulated permease PerM